MNIPLHGTNAVAVIDDVDNSIVSPFKWYLRRATEHNRSCYALTYIKTEKGWRALFLHRLLMSDAIGEIDHINGNGLDNRRCNLRSATRSQNMANIFCTRRNKIGVKGVYWHTQRNRWTAQICKDGRRRHLGLFDSIEDAQNAYADAASRLFGEFSRI